MSSTIRPTCVYKPFGEAVQTTMPEFGFTGQRFEATIGLYDYRARWYDPGLGRFVSPDPLVPRPDDPQSFNRYSYVDNDPVSRSDPTGLTSCEFTCGADASIVLESNEDAGFRFSIIIGSVVVQEASPASQTFVTEEERRQIAELVQAVSGETGIPVDTLEQMNASQFLGILQGILNGAPGSQEQSQSGQPTFDPNSGRAEPVLIGPVEILTGIGSVARRGVGALFGRLFGGSADDAARIAGQSIDDLARAAAAPARGGLTAAGRALAKKTGRPGSAFPKATGNPTQINRTAQGIVDDILRNPGTTGTARQTGRFGRVTDVVGPDGRGLRFDASGRFIGFLEP